ncbi:sugar-binding transcriptional regulator [Marivita hallyeonensis]|uniref:DNA-binding transcriptional regulator LsrR, DeoR family n=1 Tax=Marivita hallyeonensis TaxID=996342 RepID=A0A1M5SDG5_9RHOB|nr:sugar-binding domain-containing protein [Marivita hallyeonensis]SHH36511.1 DNA-binding transcriptional regulator LsrR, DeoR family [Marivita hallyeonensis]
MLMQKRQADNDIAQAAWLYYVGNLSQQDVSKRLGISRFKVLRMLADAREQGLVRIAVEHRTARTLALADRLVSLFGLQEVQVAPVGDTAGDDVLARNAVAILASGYLARIAGSDAPVTVGVGWGRTLSAMADNLTGVRNSGLTFVSLMGSVTYASHTAPGDVCVRLAAQTGGQAILLPAPFVADNAEACERIMSQRLVREAIGVARRADHAFMSVGECQEGAILFDSDIFSADQIQQLRDADVVGDCCGVFYRADGTVADIELNRSTPCVQPSDMADMDTVLLAGGSGKLAATLAVLRAGYVKKLLVDEGLANALLAAEENGGA